VWMLSLDGKSVWTEVVTNGKQDSVGTLPTREFLGRYHHNVHATQDGIVFVGGRNEDHTLCLYIEEASENMLGVHDSCKAKQIDVLRIVDPNLSPAQVEAWLKSIYLGRTQENKNLAQNYGEIISPTVIFSQRIRELAMDETCLFHDITLKTEDGKECPGHRVLFCSTSGFFEAMFDSSAVVDAEKTISIDLDFESVTVLKEFCSSSIIRFTQENIFKVVAMANKFLLDGLESLAISWIVENFSLFDPFEVTVMAVKLNMKPLETYCVWFLRCNYHKFPAEKFQGLPEKLASFIEANQWPGQKYLTEKAEWDEKAGKINWKAVKKGRVGGGGEKCVLQ